VDLDRARDLLTAELADLDQRARFAADTAAETASGDVPASDGPIGQHPGDFGTDVANRMESEALVRTVDEQRRRVEEALARIDGGTYGRCDVCGREIDDERLEARPVATTCRDHADTRVPQR
jgi:RNA polymerase-binding transcription factor DksA